MEMAPGALPHPGRVLEQRLLSPEICLRRRRSYGTILEILLTPLGFSVPRLYIGEGASSGGCQGLLTHRGRGQDQGRATLVCGWPLAPSGSLLVLVLCSGKIGVLELVSSNSKNISCVAFLKHKTAENRELALWHLVNRLNLEIA
jgi:hypothetical protein